MAASSLLGALATAPGPKKNDPKSKRAEAILVEKLECYAALAKVAKEITDGYLKSSPVRDTVLQHFIETGTASGRTPETCSGEEGKATASLQLRKKNNASALSADVVGRCKDLGVTVEHYVIVPGAVIVNPKYMDQTDSLEKLLAMAKKAGFADDFFQMQTEVSREIVCDETLFDIFAMAKAKKISPLVARELVESVTSLTVVAKYNGDLADALEIVRGELVPAKASQADAATETAAEAKPAATAAPKGNPLMDALKRSLAEEEAKQPEPKRRRA